MSVAIQPQAVQASTQVSTQHSGNQMMEEACQGMSVEESSGYRPPDQNPSYAQVSNPAPPFASQEASASESTDLVFGPTRATRSILPQGPYTLSPQLDPSPTEYESQIPPLEGPAPKQPKKQQDMGGQWMYNSGWTGEAHPCLLGWLFVQGWFDWGACLSWHVQRSHVINPGSLHWQCWVWYKEKTYNSWRAYLLLTEDIPDSDRETYKAWMIHEEGDA